MEKGQDTWMRLWMGTLLRVGVITAAVVVLTGGILFFFQHPGEIIHYTTFHGEPSRLRHLTIIWKEASAFHSRAVIQFGLILLIATPVVRVLFSWIGFLVEKDWIYVLITFLVLVILLGSLFSSYLPV